MAVATRTGAGTTAGLAVLVAGICLIIAPPLSAAFDPAWFLTLVAFAALIYGIPGLHRYQEPGDGAVGLWGSRLVLFGGGLVLALGIVFLIWEAVGTPPDDNEGGVIDILWMVGFFSFVIGMILFSIGAIRAQILPKVAAILIPVGLVLAIGIDMATGAFFGSEEEMETATEWGFFIGVPIVGLGLAWMGYAAWKGQRAPVTGDAPLSA